MRYSIVMLACFLLFACGKTGALYLPEKNPEPAPPPQPAQPQDTERNEKAE
ncbi:MAG: lipoprotein [Thiotrichales bacterium]|nr:MAG: lipoprotein [Thiotrichales bacterium]